MRWPQKSKNQIVEKMGNEQERKRKENTRQEEKRGRAGVREKRRWWLIIGSIRSDLSHRVDSVRVRGKRRKDEKRDTDGRER